MNVAEIRGLTVRYGAFTALDGLSVDIPEGCIGLLGPNGAGKTTLLKTILGFVDPAGGGGTVLGHDIVTEGRQIRQKIGLMPEQDCHIPGMSAVTFVAYAGELAGMPSAHALRRAHEVLEYCGLGEARYRNVETYSTGMKQRVKFAQALVHGPKLLLLDEPTNGLDPRGREEMLDLVQSVSHGKGVNVIVSSHLLPDIERTCDQVVLVFKGQLRAQGLVKDLKRIEGHPLDIELKVESPSFIATAQNKGAKLVEAKSTSVRLIPPGPPSEATRFVLVCAKEAGAQVRGLKQAERSLEDIFLEAVASPAAQWDLGGQE
jgi:ABC-2 type transport system ATP-binding protein